MSAAAIGAAGICAAVLAAGMASRFGSCKALASLTPDDPGGETLLGRVLAALPKELPTVVVTGAYRDQIEAHVAALPTAARPHSVTCAFNPDYQQGIASSLQIAAANAHGSPLLVTFADLPFVTAADYRRLMAAYAAEPPMTTFAEFDSAGEPTFGPPVIFAPADIAKLFALKGDQGAKKLFRADHPLRTVAIPAAGRDIDFCHQLLSI